MSCRGRRLKNPMKMFVVVWAALLVSVRRSDADAGALVEGTRFCPFRNFCITLLDEIRAHAGLCVVIPCTFTTDYGFSPQHLVWYKCDQSKERCGDSDVIFHTDPYNNKVQPGFKGRVSLLESDLRQRNCSIIINDVTESDSGLYQLRVNGWSDRFLFKPRTAVYVGDLTQKPTVEVPPLTEGHEAELTCTAPRLCSGSDPEITWIWNRGEKNVSHIPGSITSLMTETVTTVALRHSSTLTFNLSAEHHGTSVICRVSFVNNVGTEETVTLNVVSFPKILPTSGCEVQSDVLTCECVSEAFPLPTIQWPVLKNHSEYSIITTASKRTVSSIVTFTVKDQTHSATCVSSNKVGKVQENINIRNSARREGHVFRHGCHTAVVPWVIAAVALIVNVICICTMILWKKRAKPKTNQEERTYMSLQKTERSSEYEVIGQPMR